MPMSDLSDPAFRARLEQAARLLNGGQAAEARAMLQQLLAQAPNSPTVIYLLGGVSKLEGDLAGAEERYRASLALEPRQPQVENSLGVVLRARGRLGDAVAAFGRAVDLAPTLIEARLNLGFTALDGGRADVALAAFDAALAAHPDHARALTGKGQALLRLDRPGEARACFRQVTTWDPKASRAAHGEASSLLAMGAPAEALDVLAKAIANEPKAPDLFHLVGRAAFAAGRADEAEAAFRQALALAPQHLSAHRDLSQLLYMQGHQDKVFDAYSHALDQAPDHPGLLAGMAEVAILTDAPDEVLGRLAGAVERGVTAPSVLDAFGLALAASGRYDMAATVQERAITAAPNNKVLAQNYAATLLRAHRFGDAVMATSRAVTLDRFDQMSWAYHLTALQCLGDPQADELFDPATFVEARTIATPPGYDSLEAFNSALAADLASLHKMSAEPFDQSLRGGTQVELSRLPNPPETVRLLKEALAANVAAFIQGLPAAPAHPFLTRNTGQFSFSGMWSVRLRQGGHHVGHAHPQGWISSCYYAHLPRETAGDPARRGWIYFGVPPIKGLETVAPAHYVEPQEGTLVLFPSYLWHGTVPFDGDDTRVTVAFDAVPVASP